MTADTAPGILTQGLRHLLSQCATKPVLLDKESKMVELGVFLPVLNNGWVISTAAPQYHPSYAMNKAMTLLAEDLGFSFVLSPVKYRGFGGPTEHWDYVLESFEVMAGPAVGTERIRRKWLGDLLVVAPLTTS